MNKPLLFFAILLLSAFSAHSQNTVPPVIEVTGSATVNIVPDRITIEIGMEEYYRQNASGDSTLVSLSEIEKKVRNTLQKAFVPESMIVVSELGNYRNRLVSNTLLMAKRLSATVSDFDQIELIADRLDRNGITSFNITKIDNSDFGEYNRQGLKAALEAARQKAEFIAKNEGLTLLYPYEITENTNDSGNFSAFSNVAYDAGAGMENMRRIVRRYSVRVRYLFNHD